VVAVLEIAPPECPQQDPRSRAKELVGNVTAQADADDQDHQEPGLARVEDFESRGAVGFVWQHGQDDARDQHELHDGLEVLIAETPRESVELGFELKKDRHAAADSDSERQRGDDQEGADAKHQQGSHIGGGSHFLGILPKADPVRPSEHGREAHQRRGHDPAAEGPLPQDGRHRSQDCDEGEGPHPDDSHGGVLTLEAD